MILNKIGIVLIILFCTLTVFSQEEKISPIVKFLDKIIVQDVVFDKDTSWVLTNRGLVKTFNDSIELYEIDTNVTDKLVNYLFKGSENCPFYYITRNKGNVVWMATLTNNNFSKIENGFITSYNKIIDDKYTLMGFEADDEGSLWQFYESDNSKTKKQYRLFKLSDDQLSEYSLQFPRNSVIHFFIKGIEKYFIIKAINKIDYLVRFKNKRICKYIKLPYANKHYWYTHFVSKDTIYLLRNDFVLNVIVNDSVVASYKLINLKPSSIDFKLVVYNGDIYIGNNKLIKYELFDSNYTEYKSKHFEENCFYDYGKIRLNEYTKELWCIYGDIIKPDCVIDKGDYLIPRIFKAGITIFTLPK